MYVQINELYGYLIFQVWGKYTNLELYILDFAGFENTSVISTQNCLTCMKLQLAKYLFSIQCVQIFLACKWFRFRKTMKEKTRFKYLRRDQLTMKMVDIFSEENFEVWQADFLGKES